MSNKWSGMDTDRNGSSECTVDCVPAGHSDSTIQFNNGHNRKIYRIASKQSPLGSSCQGKEYQTVVPERGPKPGIRYNLGHIEAFDSVDNGWYINPCNRDNRDCPSFAVVHTKKTCGDTGRCRPQSYRGKRDR